MTSPDRSSAGAPTTEPTTKQASYALRLAQKGYTVAEMARVIGCTVAELEAALARAEAGS